MKKRGFTLIELVAVLGIISIVSAVTIMKFNIIDNFKANIELQTLINDCDYAKMKAISTGETYTLAFTNNTYSVYGASTLTMDAPIKRELNYIYFNYYNMSKMKLNLIKMGMLQILVP